MKKVINVTMLITLVAAVFIIIAQAQPTPEQIRYRQAVVVSNDNKEIVSVQDTDGNYWSFYITEGTTLTKGKRVRLTLNDNATEGNIYDDIVEDYMPLP